jgi:3-oxoadipate enol-lactonase / 4-carboxymuconolactone decarboxylase
MSTVPAISGVQLGGAAGQPLLVCGPSLGTSVVRLWGRCAEALASEFHVVGWDLPGHGSSGPAQDGFSMADLAAGVCALIEQLLIERGESSGSFYYAGDSVGGAVGLQLMLDHPGRVTAATLLSTGAKIGTAGGWSQRADLVRASGTPAVAEASALRWFAPGFVDREPAVADALLQALRDVDRSGYAWVCDALADFDVRTRLGEITTPVLAVAGAADVATPVGSLREIADGVGAGCLRVLDGVAHLGPAEAPAEVAQLIVGHCFEPRTPKEGRTTAQLYAAGMAVRRQVLGDTHVDRATASITEFTEEFQQFITQYAWGTIWTRPGLDRRSRSLITLSALVARGHHEELALHLRAARTNGLSNEEIKEVLLQSAIYCGVPDANAAFRVAQRVLAEIDAEGGRS